MALLIWGMKYMEPDLSPVLEPIGGNEGLPTFDENSTEADLFTYMEDFVATFIFIDIVMDHISENE